MFLSQHVLKSAYHFWSCPIDLDSLDLCFSCMPCEVLRQKQRRQAYEDPEYEEHLQAAIVDHREGKYETQCMMTQESPEIILERGGKGRAGKSTMLPFSLHS